MCVFFPKHVHVFPETICSRAGRVASEAFFPLKKREEIKKTGDFGMKRIWIFRFMAVVFAFCLLALLEAILRGIGYGYDTHLFVSDPDHAQYWMLNRDISKKYFPLEQNATVGNQEPFLKTKSPSTLRLFVLGASTSLGFPYMHNGSFARMLQYKLQFEYPDYHIELINLSLTAVNSYTLLDFARQIVKYQPDGILLYAGHNEYYGALGAATSGRIGNYPCLVERMIEAKNLRIVQMLQAFIRRLTPSDSMLINPDNTLMERMAAHRRVPFNSEVYLRGIKQFKRNLDKMITLFGKHHIPVFIGTLTFNLKDQPPLDKSDPVALETYRKGLLSYERREYTQASNLFKYAKETDGLRFRAPEEFNEMICEYAKALPHVFLVDIAKDFEAASPQSIPGKELLLEHVHPNLQGQLRMADAFSKVLKKEFQPFQSVKPAVAIDLQKDFPQTPFDSIYGALVIHQLKLQWPFHEQPPVLPSDTTFEYKTAVRFFLRKINWGEAMQRLNNQHIMYKDFARAARIVEQMCLELPNEKAFLRQAGSLNLRLGNQAKAAYYFKRAGYGK